MTLRARLGKPGNEAIENITPLGEPRIVGFSVRRNDRGQDGVPAVVAERGGGHEGFRAGSS